LPFLNNLTSISLYTLLKITMASKNQKSICLTITQGEVGGAARYVFDMAVAAQTADFVVTIAYGAHKNDWLGNQAEAVNIPVQFLRFIKRNINPIYDVLGLIELYKFYKKNSFDIVHLNSNKIGIIGALAAKLAKVPKIIFTVHGWAFDDPRPWWERRVYIMLNKFFIKFVDQVIAVSEYAKQSAFNIGIKTHNFTIIHNGIDLIPINEKLSREYAKKFLHKKYQTNVTQFLVSTIANFYPTKGIMYLAEAINKIVKNNPEFHFCLIGKGEQKDQLQNFIHQNNLTKNISIISDIDNARLLLPAFDLLVLPSVKECYPYVLLEAMCEGIPIVASRVGGVTEALYNYPENQYKLIPAQDPDSLAQAIVEKINTQRLSREQIADIIPKISRDKMIKQTLAIYG